MKKLNKQDYIFRGLQNQQLEKLPGQIDGQSFLCKQLVNCEVYLCDYISSIYVLNCENSQIYLGPVKTAIFVRNCKNCIVVCAAQQVRVSDSENIKIYGFSKTDFTIENCKGLKIAPYNFRYKGLKQHFENVGLDFNLENRIFRVMDFTPSQESYQVLDKDDFEGYVDKDLETDGELDNPVRWPKYFGGDLYYDVFKRLDCQDAQTMMDPNKNKSKIQQQTQDKPQQVQKQEIQNLSKNELLKLQYEQREQQKQNILREKNMQEMEKKKQRIQQAQKQKQQFIEDYKKQIQNIKNTQKQKSNENSENESKMSTWSIVKENISLKVSDQNNTKDMSSFKRCLQNKFDDNN